MNEVFSRSESLTLLKSDVEDNTQRCITVNLLTHRLADADFRNAGIASVIRPMRIVDSSLQ
jgi:hypothetical protein